jgi:hypothetical protein
VSNYGVFFVVCIKVYVLPLAGTTCSSGCDAFLVRVNLVTYLPLLTYRMQLFVSILLTKQPFFVSGIADYSKARQAAYGAMWAYVVSFGLSIILFVRDNRRQSQISIVMRSTYAQVPTLPIQDYNLDLPSSVDEGIYTTEGGFS